MTALYLQSIYEYISNDKKVLSFCIDERFIVIKSVSKPSDWLYVANSKGRLGYVPANYVIELKADDSELVNFIDFVAIQLDTKNNDLSAITDRQVKHAQIKLAQLRCEIVQRLLKKKHPEVIPENSDTNDEDTDSDDDTVILNNESLNNDIKIQKNKQCHNNAEIVIPDSLIPELIERVRLSSDLNHAMCTLTIKTVIECLSEIIPEWSSECSVIIKKLASNVATPDTSIQCSDVINLKSVFKKLWYCKNDEQQRSWPVHEDEDIIKGLLEELLTILSDANPMLIRDTISKDNYDNVHMLVTYFQMEMRRSLRMKLFSVFLSLIPIFDNIIPDYLLTSVLPSELSTEMQNYAVTDAQRWTSAAVLFTALFSTGHKPPINVYEHINEKFIIQNLNVIEGFDANGQKVEYEISPESSIAPLLSFNLHIEDPKNNIILNALKKRRNASQLTENLVSYLNWEEDITRVCGSVKKTNDRPNAVLKFLIEMFGDSEVSKLFYFNDVRVVMDIIIRQLNNLPAGDRGRASYLILARSVIRNTPYCEEPHKLNDFCTAIKAIEEHECSTEMDKQLVIQIKNENPNLFVSL